jgi:hypothetical protein
MGLSKIEDYFRGDTSKPGSEIDEELNFKIDYCRKFATRYFQMMLILLSLVFVKRICMGMDTLDKILLHFIIISIYLVLMQVYLKNKQAMRFIPYILALLSYFSHNRSLAFYRNNQ